LNDQESEFPEGDNTADHEIDPIGLYLSEIGKFPLLSPLQEQQTAAEMQHGLSRLQKHLFRSDFVALKAVALIRSKLDLGEQSNESEDDDGKQLDSCLKFKRDGSDGSGGFAGVRLRLSANVATIERLLGAIQDSLPLLYDTSRTYDLRFNEGEKVFRARGKIAKLLHEAGMRRPLIKQLQQDFLDAAKNPESFWQEQGADMVRVMRERLGKPPLDPATPVHLALFGESAERLSRRVALVNNSSERYEAARAKLWQHNLRLGVSTAKNWAKNPHDLQDRIQDANEGLGLAVDGFEPERGFKFSTYATPWTKQRARKGQFENVSGISRKVSATTLVNRVRKAQGEFTQQHGRMGDEYELAAFSRISVKDARMGLRLISSARSLDEPIGGNHNDGGGTRGDYTEARTEETTEQKLDREWLRELTHPSAKVLKQRESLVVRLRYGLLTPEEHEKLSEQYQIDTRPGLTLEAVGKIIKVTRERVRQIELKALAKIRVVLERRPGWGKS
jgi:RNA polymerase sigma factor (sigma-70 family)